MGVVESCTQTSRAAQVETRSLVSYGSTPNNAGNTDGKALAHVGGEPHVASALPEERRQVEDFTFEELFRPLHVFRHGICPDASVVLRLGPIVGKVTDSLAVVLVEVETQGDVMVNFARVSGSSSVSKDAMTTNSWGADLPFAGQALQSLRFSAQGSVSICQTMEPGRPYTICAEGLYPQSAYMVLLGNVCQVDIDCRMARFRTHPEYVESLRLVAVSGHHPPVESLGAADPWQRLNDFASQEAEVQMVLHVGCTIDAIPAADEAMHVLRDYSSFKPGIRSELEQRARDSLRGALAAAWGRHSGLRRALAVTGSQMPAFETGLEKRNMQVMESSEEWRTLVGIAVDMTRQYQRALWFHGTPEGMPDARINAAASGPCKAPENPAFWTRNSVENEPGYDEWHFHRYGRISVLVLHPPSTSVISGAFSDRRRLLSKHQRDAITDVLQDLSIEVVVIVSSLPLALEPLSDENSDAVAESPKPGLKLERVNSYSESEDCVWLLESLFQWKNVRFPSCEAVFVSSGPGFGTTGDICDHRLGLSLPTVLTGPMLGRVCGPAQWKLRGEIADGRFSYSYRPPSDQWNFCFIDIDTTEDKPAVALQVVGVPVPAGTVWVDGR